MTRNNLHRRRGVAPLEFVLALPLLVSIWVLLIWLGNAVVSQSSVTVEARRQATAERFDVTDGKPLRFLENGLIRGKETTLTRSVKQPVRTGRLTDDMPVPQSSFTVQAGTWDHRQIPLDDAPSWTEITTIAVSGQLSGLQEVVASVKNIADNPGDFAAGAFSSIAGGGGGGGGGSTTPLPQDEELDTSKSEVDREKLRQRRDNARAKLAELEIQRKESFKNLLKLTGEEAALSATSDLEERQSISQQIQIEKNRLRRIESDIDYYEEEKDNAEDALDQ